MDAIGGVADESRGAEASAEGHINGTPLPTMVNGWPKFPSVRERYFTTYTTGNHQCVHVHSNGCGRAHAFDPGAVLATLLRARLAGCSSSASLQITHRCSRRIG